MGLNEWLNKLRGTMSRMTGDGTRRPDGGTSHYRPSPKKSAQAAEGWGGYPGQNGYAGSNGYPAQGGYTGQNSFQDGYAGQNGAPSQSGYGGQNGAPSQSGWQGQPVPYAHTGFTGMNPPVQSGAWEPVQGSMTGMTPGYGMPQAGAYSGAYGAPAADGRSSAPQAGRSFRQTQEDSRGQASRPEQGWFPRQDSRPPQNNISYMPGVTPESGAPVHVEHIMTMTGMKSCYEAIECMRNGETLIVILDAIADEGERLRCQDMLAGAAFTLGCQVRMLHGAGVVMIAPSGVMILPEITARPEMQAPPAYEPVQAAQAPAYEGRRERRSSQNMADWNAARNGERDHYNPYTGTLPAAAGAYGSFGGYGV